MVMQVRVCYVDAGIVRAVVEWRIMVSSVLLRQSGRVLERSGLVGRDMARRGKTY